MEGRLPINLVEVCKDVNSEPHLVKSWDLTQQALDMLLAFLSPNREAAGIKYENIRKKLITFFECRHCIYPEECTDITINRVARKISEGKEIYASDPLSFFFGVARRVLQEYWEHQSKISASLDLPGPPIEPSQDPGEMEKQEADRLLLEQQIECLEGCLEKLPYESHELIIQYYYGETGIKIKGRKRLADKLGVQISALRVKALRIREKLETCVDTCLNQLPKA
jgi:DNA-directed RNA polymerase specialized sigma24 family protein